MFVTEFGFLSYLFFDFVSDSLEKWFEEKKRAVWFKVNIKDAAWVPILANVKIFIH